MATFADAHAMSSTGSYPVDLQVDPPEKQSRLTVFFRIFMVIPHVLLLYFVQLAQSVVTLLAWFAILITGKYPAGMMNFSVRVLHWQTRVSAYMYFLTGVYPPFAMGPQQYPVNVHISAAAEGRNRLTVFFRIFMIIPHIVVLYFVSIVASICLLVAWLVGTFTGMVPAGVHNFLAGTIRWSTRLNAYALLLTDEYPPFSMN